MPHVTPPHSPSGAPGPSLARSPPLGAGPPQAPGASSKCREVTGSRGLSGTQGKWCSPTMLATHEPWMGRRPQASAADRKCRPGCLATSPPQPSPQPPGALRGQRAERGPRAARDPREGQTRQGASGRQGGGGLAACQAVGGTPPASQAAHPGLGPLGGRGPGRASRPCVSRAKSPVRRAQVEPRAARPRAFARGSLR